MAKFSSSLALKSVEGRSEFHSVLFNTDIICVSTLHISIIFCLFKETFALDFFYYRLEINTTLNMWCDCFNIALVLGTFLHLSFTDLISQS